MRVCVYVRVFKQHAPAQFALMIHLVAAMSGTPPDVEEAFVLWALSTNVAESAGDLNLWTAPESNPYLFSISVQCLGSSHIRLSFIWFLKPL